MPTASERGPSPRKELHIFYVLDTSGSMTGTKISTLNHAMEECTQVLKTEAQKNGDAMLKIAVLEFNSGARWITSNGPEAMEDFEWEYLTAGGLTDMGMALDELNSKLHKSEFLGSMMGAYIPIIIFMTDGAATDDYEGALAEIRQNEWFRHSTKIGFAIGDEADSKMIASVVGDSEAVIKTSDLELFARLLRFVTVTSSMRNTSITPESAMDGKSIVADARRQMDIPDSVTVELKPEEYDPEPDPVPDDEWGEEKW